MLFQLKSGSAARQSTACAVLPVYQKGRLPETTAALDKACGGLIAAALQAGDLTGRRGETLLLATGDNAPCRRVLLVGCGERGSLDAAGFGKLLAAAYAALRRTRYADAMVWLTAERVRGADAYRRARIAVETWHNVAYRYTATRSEDTGEEPALRTLGLGFGKADAAKARRGIRDGDAIGKGMDLARELGNLPANICTPGYLASTARKLAKGNARLKVEVLGEAEMRKLKMGSLLSVTAGSDEPAKLIVMNYQGAARSKRPVVLVGKGITFDSGGISLKPPPQMDEMKWDMGGAASVFGVIKALSELGIARNVIGVVPACENLPSGRATKPGDVVTSMSGKTIEILNTDAEGRLILCDALTYSQRFKPAALIDIATLTGACVIALGKHRSGLLANSDPLAKALLDAGERAGDRAWRLPLGDEYQQQLKSNFADMANVGGREAGTITAACFLSRFVEDAEWAHLDIAGTAWRSGGPAKGGTGRPVPLLTEYLLSL